MIIYSTVPMEIIFADQDKLEKQQLHEIKVGEVLMLVEPVNTYEGKIVRLISPDPMDYTNPAYAPGQIVSFHPSF
ncbi:YlzJ-like family protein [Brevibacillus daliensis]|uniref:YlzJ-like family protein n=1 Tax=Brevibacillus daliensis TaxID=2892995 RepID=UPI001E4AF081|nr:YlzJ-like family protein [Brevibacillus daliensis]